MLNTKDWAIKKLKETNLAAETWLKEIDNLPELEGIDGWFTHSGSELTVTMPYDLKLYTRNRDALIEAGWEWDRLDFVREWCGDILTDFTKTFEEVTLMIHFHVSPSLRGSTCKRNIIGYQDPKPIYEVVCNEMAND